MFWKRFTRHSMKTRITLATLVIFVAGNWLLTAYISQMLHKDMARVLGNQQFSTVSMIAAEVNQEMSSRIQSLEVVAQGIVFAGITRPSALQARLAERPVLQTLFNDGVAWLDTNGTVIADFPREPGRTGVNLKERDYIIGPLTQGKSMVGTPVLSKLTHNPTVVMAVPVKDRAGKVIGVFAGIVNLGKPNFLDQITQSNYGMTGGHLLVVPKSRLIVSATDKSRIMEKLPEPGINPSLDRFIQGYEGSDLLMNPRGMEVLVSAKGIPAAGWYIATTLPVEEAFAPIRSMQQHMLMATLVMTLLSSLLIWWILRHQLSPMISAAKVISTLASTDQPPQPLPILREDEIGDLIGSFNRLLITLGQRERALHDSEENLSITLQSIGDAVIATDAAGRITRMNATAEQISGWTLADARHRPLSDIFRILNAKTRQTVANPVQLVMDSGLVVGLANHTVLVARDGTEYHIADSAAPIRNTAGDIVGVVLVFSDVTDKNRMELALQESEFRWKFAIEGSGDGVWDWNIQTGQAQYSKRWKEMMGFAESEIKNTASEWSDRVHCDDLPDVMKTIQAHMDGKTPSASAEYRMLDKTGHWRWILGRGMVVSRDADGKALRLIGTSTDITERKQVEEVNAFLSHIGGVVPGEPFFDALARFLAKTIQVDYVCIDRLEGDGLNATTLAVWHDGHFEDNVTYALKDTPCGNVVGQTVCCFPASVCQFFPNDSALQELRAESYMGVTLWSHSGQPIGLIAVIARHPLTNHAHAAATLERIAMRASAELERLKTEEALAESETRFRSLIEGTREAVVVHRDSKFVYLNPSAIFMLGATSAQELLGRSVLDFVHPDFHPIVRSRIKQEVEDEKITPLMEEKFIRLDGQVIDVEVQATPMVYLGQDAIQVGMRDITQHKQAEKRLRLAAGVFTHAREGIVMTSADATIIDVNDAFSRITGYSQNEVVGQNPRLFKSGRQSKEFYDAMWRDLGEKGYWNGEIWNCRKNGEVFAEILTISAVTDEQGNTVQYVGLFSDITALKEHQNQLEHIAHFDVLTNLPNRLLLSDRLQQALMQAQRRGLTLAVAYIDLDGFKAINDCYGHAAGDQLLITVSSRMKQALREGDTLARLGGDEFVAVLGDLEDTSASMPMLLRVLAAAAQPVQAGENTLVVSASLGVTFYPQAQEMDAEQLLRQADQAMYQAKVAGKNRYHVFDTEHDSSIRVQHESLERIRQALLQRELVLYYQPKVNMRTGAVVGVEALIRWEHPNRGLQAPAMFLPFIEHHPLAIDMGEWVMDTALTQIELWCSAGLNINISINVGAYQLQQADFVDRLRAMLAKHPLVNPSCLEIEILETSALEDIAQISELIAACTQLGVTFTLDDFGTGYSSLTYLKRLRVGMIKIDQSFVRDMLDDPDDRAILEGIIGLTHAFRCKVIAEGVETTAHGALLLQLGCELVQGNGIAHPMPACDFPQWIATWQSSPAWLDKDGGRVNLF